MAFTQGTYAPVGAHSTDTPTIYSYRTNDTLAQVKAEGYFSLKSAQLEQGDFVFVQASDGSDLLEVSSDSSTTDTATFIQTIKNRVVINDNSDLPTVVGGKIPTVANTEYFIGSNAISHSDPFDIKSNVSFMGAFGPAVMTYTGAASQFTGADVGLFNLTGITLVHTGGGDVFDITDASSGSSILLTKFAVVNAASLGNISGVNAVALDFGQMLGITDGVLNQLAGAGINILSIDKVTVSTVSATFKGVDFGSVVIPSIDISDFVVNGVSGSIGITGLAANGNISANSVAKISSCEFLGGMTALDTITEDDFRYDFQGNTGIADTNADALIFFAGNSSETAIVTQNVGVQVNGTWTEHLASHFTTTSGGNVTYNGERELSRPLDVDVGLKSATGTFDAFLEITIDDVVIATGISVAINTSKPTLARVQFQHTFAEDEVFKVLVVNMDGTGNIVVESATARIG